ncbi:uncharacterized protein LOC143910785 [Arctopsyche grandis]|uniref:uncharacterized protein LOC143910785 n=1 Tax=Arctopsyche grandis TaxID=121162 RepID=UPI00406D6301
MAITLIDIGIFVIAFLLAIYYYGIKFYDHFKNTDVKYIKPSLPFLGSMSGLLLRNEDMVSFFKRIYDKYPDEKYVGLFDNWRPLILIKDLELIKQLGIKDFETFHDHRTFTSGNNDDLFAFNLFIMKDERWKEMRAALSPAFTSSKMRNMFVFVEECAKDTAEYYMNVNDIKEKGVVEIDVRDSVTRYTNDVIASSAFGIQINSNKDRDNEFYKLGRLGSDFSGIQILKLFGILMFPKIMKILGISFTRPVVSRFFKKVVNEAIKNREDNGIIRHDLINLLMEAKKGTLVHDTTKETCEVGFATVQESEIGKQQITRKWTDTELAAQAYLFFLGGFDTSATLITLFIYEMVRNWDIQKKLQEEIDDFMDKSDGKITYNDILNLKYLDMTISETLRMWPPAGVTDRICTKTYTLSPPNKNSNKSYKIKANELIWIPIYGLLHDPKYFPDPERFDPERFSDKNKASIDPISYLPFGIGPRNCIGSRFALMEIKLFALHLLSKFDIVPTKNTRIPIELEKGVIYIGLFDNWRPLIMIKDLELMKQVGIKDFDHFHDHRSFTGGSSDDLFGCNLFVMKGDRWKEMRAALSPAFTSSKMRNMFVFIEECARNMADYYMNEKDIKEKGLMEIEVKDSVSRYTNDVIASAAFGIQVNSIKDRDNEFYKLGRLGSDFSGIQLLKFFGFSLIPKVMSFFKIPFTRPVVTKFFKNLVTDAIKNREESGLIRHDLINLLMEAKKGTLEHDATKETSEAGFATVQESVIGQQKVVRKWTDTELTAQAFLFFIAGFETSATSITFFFYEMVRNPDIQKRLQEEIDDILLKSEGKLTYTDVQNMKYLDMTISETLRMWPPAAATDRVCTKSFVLPPPHKNSNKSYTVSVNELVWIPIYSLLHDPKYFPNPGKFDPERFSDENKSSIDPITYLPFGIGPRNCIGSRFALMEIKLIAFHLLSKFDIVPTKNTKIPLEIDRGSLQLKIKNGLSVGLKPRSNKFKSDLIFATMAISLVDVGIFVIAFLIAVYYYGKKFYDHFKSTDVKHTKPSFPFLGSMTGLLLRKEDLYFFFKRIYDEYPDERYIGLFDNWRPLIMIRDLELIKQVGIKDFESFQDHRNFAPGSENDLFGSNLFVMKGERWKEMRAALSPAFTSSKMRNMFVFIEECAKNMAEYYINDKEVNENGLVQIEVKDTMTRYTNDVIASAAFGIQVNSIKDRDNEFYKFGRLGSDFGGLQTLKFMGFMMFPKLMQFLNIPFTRPSVSKFFKSLIRDTIKNREDSGLIRHDLINLLMEAKKGTLVHDTTKESSEAGFATVQESVIGQQKVVRKWNDDELAAQAFLFFIAGFETSATLITFLFYEIVRNPDVQKKLQEEIDDFMLKSEGKITYNDVQSLKYLDMTISETLRMWPPVAAVDRVCTKSFTLPPPNDDSKISYKIKTNDLIWIPIYGFLHDPKYFPDPEKFDPERFSDDNKSSIDPITYLPFGVGPRNCIGSRFALMEIKLIAFHILHKFNVVPTKETQIPIQFEKGSFQLKIKKGLLVGLQPYNHFKNTDVKHTKPSVPFIGSVTKLIFRKEDLYSFFKRTYNEYPGEKYTGLFENLKPLIVIKDLDLLKQIAIKDFDTFHDHRNFANSNHEDLFGNILFVMQGEKWREMRSALSPAFTSAKMRNMFIYIEECARDMADFYMNDKEMKDHGMVEFEVKDTVTRYTNDVIASSAFGIKVNSLKDRENEFYRLGKLANDFGGLQLLKFFGYAFIPGIMKLFNIPFTRPEVSKFFKNLVKETIENREKTGLIRHDMINLLMEAKKGNLTHDTVNESSETGFATVHESEIGKQEIKRKWTDTELVAQAFVFFIAGFETSSTLITFFFYEMVRNPDIQKKLQEEIDDFNSNSDGKINYNDVQTLKYLDMTISETLRMWPPLGSIDRVCSRPYTLPPPNEYSKKSYTIKADESIAIPIYGLLHDPKLFPNPEQFIPERFSDENKASIDPTSYLPFGIGPRNCIGSRFALMEIKLIVFHLMSKFDIVPTKNTQIPIELDKGSFTLKTKRGLFIGLRPRAIRGRLEIEAKESFSKYTVDVIATSAYGLKIDSFEDGNNEFLTLGKLAVTFSFTQTLKIALFSLLPKISKILNIPLARPQVTAFFKNLVYSMMRDREHNKLLRYDMIHLLMEAKKGSLIHEPESNDVKETGFATVEESSIGKQKVKTEWSDDDLAAQALIFFIGGFDTTSSVLTFFFYEVSRRPDIVKKLNEEIDELISQAGDTLMFADVQKLKYLDMCLSEVLRMWPPASAVDRVCSKTFTLPPPNDESNKPYVVEKNVGVWIPIYGIHFDEKYYPDPEKFDPERFSDDNKLSIDPASYLPFGIGPRNCIGSRFALVVVKAVIFHMLANFDITLSKKTKVPIDLVNSPFNLHAKNGVWINLNLRNK